MPVCTALWTGDGGFLRFSEDSLRCVAGMDSSSPVFGLGMDKGGFQNLDGVLAPVQGSDRVDIEIHT